MAVIKVPAKAKVRMVPKLRKKFCCGRKTKFVQGEACAEQDFFISSPSIILSLNHPLVLIPRILTTPFSTAQTFTRSFLHLPPMFPWNYSQLTLFSSYPEFKMIGGSNRLKKYPWLNVTIFWMMCPGDSFIARPTSIPVKEGGSVSVSWRGRVLRLYVKFVCECEV